jgi:predicted nucleotidyltransferase
MSSYNLSSNKIPPHLLEIIRSFQEILGEQAYDFLLIGASARDLIMDTIYDLGVSRSTEDVDFALYVPEWGIYKEILQKLIDSGQFQPTKATHKLLFKNVYEIDIVPFGDIQNNEGHYTWPPDHIKAMNVAGFVEVSAGGIGIQTQGAEFKVASVPGICMMKILAWQDRGRWDNRDGKDLGFILSNYIEMKYEDLYTLHEDLMQDEDFDRKLKTNPASIFVSTRKEIGTLFTVESIYSHSRNLAFGLDASRFLAGRYVKETGKGKNIAYLSLKANYKF